MLAGLDEIPWSKLEHAYGDAEDIPNLIRTLVSDDPHEREWAQDMLDMGPFHQGSLYSCTPFVVRFLLQLAQERDAPDKPWMLQYVSRVSASALYFLTGPDDIPDSEDGASDADTAIAEQVVAEIRPHLLRLMRFLEEPDVEARLTLLRLLVLLKADFPYLDKVLEEQVRLETQESLRAALVFCLSLAAETVTSPSALALATLEEMSAPPLMRIAAGFGVLAMMGVAVPDNVVTAFCSLIAGNFDALERFEEIYAEYLTPLGAPPGKDRLLDCLPEGLPRTQKNQLIQAFMSIYAQLRTVPSSLSSAGIRVGSAYYLGALVRLAFSPGKLPAESTIRDLTGTQRSVLEAFQRYDMPAIRWNVYGPEDYRMVLGLNFRSETDFLDFMAGKRSAR